MSDFYMSDSNLFIQKLFRVWSFQGEIGVSALLSPSSYNLFGFVHKGKPRGGCTAKTSLTT